MIPLVCYECLPVPVQTCAVFANQYPIECVPPHLTVPDIIVGLGGVALLAWLVGSWLIQLGQSFYNWLQTVWTVELIAILVLVILGYVWWFHELWPRPVTFVTEDYIEGLS